ncbi:hypothetical protein EX30DRAFT_212328, partial [Ascodesmis nigricans]
PLEDLGLLALSPSSSTIPIAVVQIHPYVKSVIALSKLSKMDPTSRYNSLPSNPNIQSYRPQSSRIRFPAPTSVHQYGSEGFVKENPPMSGSSASPMANWDGSSDIGTNPSSSTQRYTSAGFTNHSISDGYHSSSTSSLLDTSSSNPSGTQPYTASGFTVHSGPNTHRIQIISAPHPLFHAVAEDDISTQYTTLSDNGGEEDESVSNAFTPGTSPTTPSEFTHNCTCNEPWDGSDMDWEPTRSAAIIDTSRSGMSRDEICGECDRLERRVEEQDKIITELRLRLRKLRRKRASFDDDCLRNDGGGDGSERREMRQGQKSGCDRCTVIDSDEVQKLLRLKQWLAEGFSLIAAEGIMDGGVGKLEGKLSGFSSNFKVGLRTEEH